MTKDRDTGGTFSGGRIEIIEPDWEAMAKELLEALKPFANFAPKVEQFIEGTMKFGGSPIFPTKEFRLADFQRAAAAISRAQSLIEEGGK